MDPRVALKRRTTESAWAYIALVEDLKTEKSLSCILRYAPQVTKPLIGHVYMISIRVAGVLSNIGGRAKDMLFGISTEAVSMA